MKGKETSGSENVAQLPSDMQYHALAPTDATGENGRTSEDYNSASRTPSLRATDTSEPRRPSRPDGPFEQWERDEMETLLTQVRGHLGTISKGLFYCLDSTNTTDSYLSHSFLGRGRCCE